MDMKRSYVTFLDVTYENRERAVFVNGSFCARFLGKKFCGYII
jgi:hypothetical protein